jgi:predicted transcriptional regulator
MKILLSIKPEFVEKIFNGTKRYEYRKCAFKREEVQTVVVYSTQPVGQIVGEFDIEDILCDAPVALWETTHEGSGIDASFFDDYFQGRQLGVAIKIGSTRLFDVPVDPKTVCEKFVAPQSFRYLSKEMPFY